MDFVLEVGRGIRSDPVVGSSPTKLPMPTLPHLAGQPRHGDAPFFFQNEVDVIYIDDGSDVWSRVANLGRSAGAACHPVLG